VVSVADGPVGARTAGPGSRRRVVSPSAFHLRERIWGHGEQYCILL